MAFKHPDESRIKLTELMLPSHSNFSGKIHGGYILSLMDQVAFACASKHSGHYCVTASVDKVDFLNPIEVGEIVNLKAQVNYTGRTSMVIGVRVESENIKSGKVKHCNSSYFTMVAKNDDGSNAPIPGLILDTVDNLRRFSKAVEHKSDMRETNIEFSPENFNWKDHLSQVEKQNVQIDERMLRV